MFFAVSEPLINWHSTDRLEVNFWGTESELDIHFQSGTFESGYERNENPCAQNSNVTLMWNTAQDGPYNFKKILSKQWLVKQGTMRGAFIVTTVA